MKMNVDSLRSAHLIRTVLELLAKRDYEAVCKKDLRKAYDPETIQRSIDGFDHLMTIPPFLDAESLDIYETDSADEMRVVVDLWFDNQPSDLSICMSIFSDGRYSIDNIRVL